jgi:hypothetical protein
MMSSLDDAMAGAPDIDADDFDSCLHDDVEDDEDLDEDDEDDEDDEEGLDEEDFAMARRSNDDDDDQLAGDDVGNHDPALVAAARAAGCPEKHLGHAASAHAMLSVVLSGVHEALQEDHGLTSDEAFAIIIGALASSTVEITQARAELASGEDE